MKPTIIVSGLGRCGSSLTMQMLHAAGVPCVGAFPAFEGPECEAFQEGFITADRWPGVAGRAVKLLDPHKRAIAWPADLNARAIWLSRDPLEQAKSQGKMAAALGGRPQQNRQDRRRWANRLAAEASAGRAGLICAMGRYRVLDVAYEQLLGEPRETALRIAQFGKFGFDGATLDAMAACVRKSDPSCAPDLAMEVDLVGGWA